MSRSSWTALVASVALGGALLTSSAAFAGSHCCCCCQQQAATAPSTPAPLPPAEGKTQPSASAEPLPIPAANPPAAPRTATTYRSYSYQPSGGNSYRPSGGSYYQSSTALSSSAAGSHLDMGWRRQHPSSNFAAWNRH